MKLSDFNDENVIVRSFVLYCWCENILLKSLVVRCNSVHEYAAQLLNIYYSDVGSRLAALCVISCHDLQ